MLRYAALASVFLTAACAVTPLPDAARLQAGDFGSYSNQDPETAAINLSAWAFASPGRTLNHPADAARAVASLDYLAGDLYANPRFAGISPVYKQQMLDARGEVRQALGIAHGAPSQLVVHRLLAAGNGLAASDRPAALAALTDPAFAYGPERTLALLNQLPSLPEANVASLRVSSAYERSGRFCGPGCG